MDRGRVRIVQITDTHFSAAAGVPDTWPRVVQWLRAEPPDLVVHTGDIVRADPDDEADRSMARRLMDEIPEPLAVIPGNHDVGGYDEDIDRPRRLGAFRSTWGHDRFVIDLAGWRLVGVDVYVLGRPADDAWLAAAMRTERPVLAFLHQPIGGDPVDGWEMPMQARDAFASATAGADVRAIASGHRHRAALLGRAVWAPSLTLTGDALDDGADPRPGLVEHRLSTDGAHEHLVLRPWVVGPAADIRSSAR